MGRPIDLDAALAEIWRCIWLSDYEKGIVQQILRKLPTVDDTPTTCKD